MASKKSVAKRDHYLVLGVTPMAGKDEIKKAYRERAKQYHPDLNPDLAVLSQEKMKELTEAYDVVSDNDARKSYDNQPQFQYRVPKDLQKAAASTSSSSRPHRSTLWDSVRRFFGGASSSKSDSGDYQIHFGAGLSCAQYPGGNLLGQAEADFSKALALRPDAVEALYNLGLVYYRQGKYVEALVKFKAVLARSANDAAAHRMVDLLQEWES